MKEEQRMEKLRLGVIGAGSWAVASHLPNLLRYADVIDFVAVNRLGREQLERIRSHFGFEIASEDYHDIINAGIDICIISSPAALHYEHARAALEAGVHILIEKPMTLDPKHAWDLVEIAKRRNRHAVVSFGWNYKPMVRDAKVLMEADGGIGEIEQIMIQMSSSTRELLSNTGVYPDASAEAVPDTATWTDPSLSGGGYGQAQLSHALGLALWLTGLRGQEVFAFMGAPPSAPVELYDAISLRFDNGAIGSLAGGSSYNGADDDKHLLDVRAFGAKGQFHVDLQRETIYRYRGPGEAVELPVELGAGIYDCVGPIDTLVELALGHDVKNCSPLELGARTVEILDAAYRSARSRAIEAVNPA
jgi:predicted dehydrogenase